MGSDNSIPPYYERKRRSSWRTPFAIALSIFAVFAIFVVVLIAIISSAFEKEPYVVKKNSVLEIDLKNGLPERPLNNFFAFLGGKGQTTFAKTLFAIKSAKNDERIKGAFIKAGGVSIGFAQAEELNRTLEDFKKSGKFVYAYLDYGSEKNYYAGAVLADKIFMAPEGTLELDGFSVGSLFFKGFLDKLGIKFNVVHFEDFKSAAESLNKTRFSDSAKLEYRVLLKQRLNLFVESLKKYRGIDKKTALAFLRKGVYSPDSLLAFGLVDTLAYESDAKKYAEEKILGKSYDKNKKDVWEKLSKKVRFVSVSKYSQDLPPIEKKSKIAPEDKKIAIVYLEGAIVLDETSPFANQSVISPKPVAKYLKKIRENDDVKAVILRVDSPGGSVLASDEIYREILKTKKLKPVYYSMGNVAASGGYYLAAACDTIAAEPSTVTGSIGVIIAIPNYSSALDKLGITADTINCGGTSQVFNAVFFKKYDREIQKLRSLAGGVYRRFIEKVAKSRGKSFEEIRAIAKGRVWSGEEAKKIGLVDVIGGLQKTIDLAKTRIGVPLDQKVKVLEYPSREDQFSLILKMFDLDDQDETLGSYLTQAIYGRDGEAKAFERFIPDEARAQFSYLANLLLASKKEKVLMAIPRFIEIK